MKRVAITGLGISNSLGAGVPVVWKRLLAGANGIRKISFFDAAAYRCTVGAEAQDIPLSDADGYAGPAPMPGLPAWNCRRGVYLFNQSATEAFADSGLAESGADRSRIGVAAGASIAYIDHVVAKEYYKFRRDDGLDVDLERFVNGSEQPEYSFARSLGDLMAAVPARALGLRGPVMTIDTACAASGHAIGSAFRMIRNGRATAMVTGGAAALVCPFGILYFAVLGALSRNPDPELASRPFDRNRDGFVMGEGGGAVVLEDMDHARARGAMIYAELAGYGSTTTALNLTDPSQDGSYEARAMHLALEDASLDTSAIQYIAAHGTSTPKNDATETLAIRRAFGAASGKLLVSSNKGQIGHTISGAAVTNLIAAVKAIGDQTAPPTMHIDNPDPELDLDFVPNTARRAPIEAALVNSFAFGGHNAVLAVRAAA